MVERRTILTAVVGVLALVATVHADMMPVSLLDSGYQQPPSACGQVALLHTGLSNPFSCPGIADLDPLLIQLACRSNDDGGQPCETNRMLVLTDGQSSRSLCLYALLALGLSKSALFIKKLSSTCLPDWYHTGGPWQIGHSFAISPDCLCSAPGCCFIRPDGTLEKCLPQHDPGTLACFLRKSQFTPTALAPRGPPYAS
jgi:hypothetical protein